MYFILVTWSLGHQVDYVTDTAEKQRESLKDVTALSRAAHVHRMKQMKADLTRASFSMGDPKEKPSYESTMKDAMKRPATTTGYPVVHVKNFGKGTSIYFGNDKPLYQSEIQRSTTAGNAGEYLENQREASHLRNSLMQPNFSIGQGLGLYSTEYQDEYYKRNEEYYRTNEEKARAKAQIFENKKAHFTMGKDAVKYLSVAKEAQETGSHENALSAQQQKELNKSLKAQLQKTSVTLGYEDEDW